MPDIELHPLPARLVVHVFRLVPPLNAMASRNGRFLCSIILSTRVYAIYDRQKWMIPFFSALVMGMVAIYVVTEVGVTTVSLPPP